MAGRNLIMFASMLSGLDLAILFGCTLIVFVFALARWRRAAAIDEIARLELENQQLREENTRLRTG